MRIVSKPIEMIAHFRDKNIPQPLKFRLKNIDHTYSIIKVDSVTEIREEKLAGIRAYVYKCQSLIKNTEKIYELKYIIEDCKWILYKI
ncbi:MAG: hypothetical protein MJA31_18125 [Clostridia bacterium]|nr:hypothetical protein [Clostridia bacterium]